MPTPKTRFRESDHLRGQPGNAGQFRDKPRPTQPAYTPPQAADPDQSARAYAKRTADREAERERKEREDYLRRQQEIHDNPTWFTNAMKEHRDAYAAKASQMRKDRPFDAWAAENRSISRLENNSTAELIDEYALIDGERLNGLLGHIHDGKHYEALRIVGDVVAVSQAGADFPDVPEASNATLVCLDNAKLVLGRGKNCKVASLGAVSLPQRWPEDDTPPSACALPIGKIPDADSGDRVVSVFSQENQYVRFKAPDSVYATISQDGTEQILHRHQDRHLRVPSTMTPDTRKPTQSTRQVTGMRKSRRDKHLSETDLTSQVDGFRGKPSKVMDVF